METRSIRTALVLKTRENAGQVTVKFLEIDSLEVDPDVLGTLDLTLEDDYRVYYLVAEHHVRGPDTDIGGAERICIDEKVDVKHGEVNVSD